MDMMIAYEDAFMLQIQVLMLDETDLSSDSACTRRHSHFQYDMLPSASVL
jgi:hypothetical protein